MSAIGNFATTNSSFIREVDEIPIFDTIKFNGNGSWFLSYVKEPQSCWKFLKPNKNDPNLYDVRFFGFTGNKKSVFYVDGEKLSICADQDCGKKFLAKQIMDLCQPKFEEIRFLLAENNCS